MEQKKIIIFNAGAYGDILNTTPIAKHYKILEPEIKITWVTRKKYESCLINNKFIDKIVFCDDIGGDNLRITNHYINFFREQKIDVKFVAPYVHTILQNNEKPAARSSLLEVIYYESSGISDWRCDFRPTVFPSLQEVSEANDFFRSLKGEKKILFEYENFSNQTPFNEKYFKILCDQINNKEVDLIFSGINLPSYFNSSYEKEYKINFHHYKGSFVSNCELYNLCDAFIGTSSGLSCLTHSDYCDINKQRVEVSWGYHWSTYFYKFMKNKKCVFNDITFKEALNNVFN